MGPETAACMDGPPPPEVPAGGAIKRKGLQLALEPLNGQGIAGYVPEP